MRRRFLSVFLAVALAFSGSGITAIASENVIEEQTEISSEVQNPEETTAENDTEEEAQAKETESVSEMETIEKTESTSETENATVVEGTEETESVSEEESTALNETEVEETETTSVDETMTEEETESITEEETLTEEETEAEDEILMEADAEVVTGWVGDTEKYEDKSWLIKGDFTVETSNGYGYALGGKRNTIIIDGDLTVNSGFLYIGFQNKRADNCTLVVNGDLIINDGEVALNKSRVGGYDNRLLVKGNCIQNGGKLEVYDKCQIDITGNFVQNGGVNGIYEAELTVGGNYSIGEKGVEKDGKRLATSSGTMNVYWHGKLVIGGNLTVCSSRGLGGYFPTNAHYEGTNTYDAYPIKLKGNLYQYGNCAENETDGDQLYAYSGNLICNVLFIGDGAQSIYMESADSKIRMISATHKELYLESPVSFIQLESDITLNVKEDNSEPVVLQHDIDLNGHKLTINGDFIHEGGCITYNGGNMEVTGDYTMGQKGDIEGDYIRATSSGSIKFFPKGTGILDIGGTFTICTNKTWDQIKGGTVRLRGDLRQYGTFGTADSDKYAYAGSFCPDKIIFCGTSPQRIYLDSPNSYFKSASFENENIIAESNICNLTLGSDAKISLSDAVISRQPEFTGTLDLNGHKLTITDDYTQTTGVFRINHGVLNITGDYTIGQQGEMLGDYRQSTSTGSLTMSNAEDFVYVDGSFTICSTARSTLSNGFMYIKGNFSQYGNYNTYSDGKYAITNSFAATGNHKVILNGSTPQRVFFESTSSYFNKLELMQSRSRYEFSRPDCYKEIIYNEAAVIAPIEDCIYTGETIIPEVHVMFDDAELTEGIDYELSFINNINASDKNSANPPTVNVTYRNGNKGETSAAFTILPRAMTDEDIAVQISDMDFTGSPLTPEPSVTYKGKSLIKDTDYVVSYEDNTDGGMASVLITGQGNFTGTVTAMFEIIMPEEQRKPINGVTAAKIQDRSYTGAGVEPKVEIYDGEKLLREYKDYKLTYFDNVKAGHAAVIVHGIGGYTGTISVPFIITKRMFTDAEVTVDPIADQTFTGTAIKPQVVVKAEGNILKAGRDYTLSYANNVNVSGSKVATVTIKGKGDCKGTRKESFIIIPASLDVTQNDDLSINVSDAAYNKGKAVKAAVSITDGSYQLKVNKDYTLSYQNNTQVSEADGSKAPTVTITGKGNYAGSTTVRNFRIYKSVISQIKVSKIAAQTYAGTRIKPQVTVTLNNQTLRENVHYTVSYGTNINAGKGEVYITGKGTYGGTKKVTFTIKKKPLSSNVILSPIEEMEYDGNAKTPSVYAYDGKKLLWEDRDYTVKYTNNKNAGNNAKVTLTGKGNYSGKINGAFTIKPASLMKDSNSDLNIIVSDAIYKNGKTVKPAVVVSDGSVILKEKRDYTVVYTNNMQLSDGTGTNAPKAVITGKGNYASDSVTKTFRICTGNITTVKVSKISNQNYTGLQIRPDVTVTEKKTGTILKEGEDYILEYGENRRIGTGYVYIKGAGTYGGMKTIKFKIV